MVKKLARTAMIGMLLVGSSFAGVAKMSYKAGKFSARKAEKAGVFSAKHAAHYAKKILF